MALLKATIRGNTGSRPAKALRNKGLVPGIIYGHGETPEAVTLLKNEVERVLLHGERLVEIDLGGKVQNALVKEVQYDPFGAEILHLDFARVNLDEVVTVTVAIVLRGTPAGATEGGVLQQIAAQASIECMVRNIPDEIRIMVNDMKIGDKLFMKDLPLPAGSKLLEDPEALVATVSVVTEKEEAPVEEAPAAPEVIGAKKEEEAEGGEEAQKK